MPPKATRPRAGWSAGRAQQVAAGLQQAQVLALEPAAPVRQAQRGEGHQAEHAVGGEVEPLERGDPAVQRPEQLGVELAGGVFLGCRTAALQQGRQQPGRVGHRPQVDQHRLRLEADQQEPGPAGLPQLTGREVDRLVLAQLEQAAAGRQHGADLLQAGGAHAEVVLVGAADLAQGRLLASRARAGPWSRHRSGRHGPGWPAGRAGRRPRARGPPPAGPAERRTSPAR